MRSSLLLIAFITLAGCTAGPAPAPNVAVAQAATSTLYVEIPARSARALLSPIGQNRDVVTWLTPDQVSLSFQDGVVVASRGLGFDLMSADVDGTRAALAGGPTQGYSRFHSYLDGENRTIFRTLVCSLGSAEAERIVINGRAIDTRRHIEACRSTDLEIENVYWVGGDGTVWRSRQWLGPEIAYLNTELVRP